MNKIGTQKIETERCILRRIAPDDYEMMYENWARYEEVCKFFPFEPVPDMEARERNNEPITLHVAKWNNDALMLYEKVGFEIANVEKVR